VVRLEVRVALEYRDQPSERSAEQALRLREPLHRGRITRRGGRALCGAHCPAARLGYSLEGLALVLEIAAHRLHQVGDEVITAPQLNIDLGKGVQEPVAQRHQAVVDRYGPEGEAHHDYKENPASHPHGFVLSCCPRL
jgi:hypothetical protein